MFYHKVRDHAWKNVKSLHLKLPDCVHLNKKNARVLISMSKQMILLKIATEK